MGATEFAIDNTGKTVGEAYDTQVDSDHYEHGHSGYTGTLAEKDGFVLIKRPTRITAGRLMDTIIDAEQWMFWLGTDEKYRHVYTKPKAKCRVAWDRLCGWYPVGPPFTSAPTARGICDIYGEKWGPALAVEQSPAEKKERWSGLPRGTKTFLFFGMAPC
jgi:hypothetical protein